MNAPERIARRIRIRRPTAAPPPIVGARSFVVDAPLKGLKVGFRDDLAWRSWTMIVKDWSERLKKSGAEPVVVITGQRTGEEGEKTKKAIERWLGSVDCAIVGLAN